MDSVGEGEGGEIWENSIEKKNVYQNFINNLKGEGCDKSI